MLVIADPINENMAQIQLTPDDVESAIRMFICECRQEFQIGFTINPCCKIQAALFVVEKLEAK